MIEEEHPEPRLVLQHDCKAHLAAQDLFDLPAAQAAELLQAAAAAMTRWQTAYLEVRAAIEESGRDARWEFSKTALFANTNYMAEVWRRCICLCMLSCDASPTRCLIWKYVCHSAIVWHSSRRLSASGPLLVHPVALQVCTELETMVAAVGSFRGFLGPQFVSVSGEAQASCSPCIVKPLCAEPL